MRIYINMCVIKYFIILVIAYSIFATSKTHAQLLRIDNEIIQRWKDYESFSRLLQVEFYEDIYIDGRKHSERRGWYRQNKNCFMTKDIKEGEKYSRIMIYNHHYYAELKEDVAQKNYILHNLVRSGDSTDEFSRDEQLYNIFTATSPHFCWQWMKLSNLVEQSSFRVDKISQVIDDGHSLMKVDYHVLLDQDNKFYDIDGTLFLDQDYYYCLRKHISNENIYYFVDSRKSKKLARSVIWHIDYQISSLMENYPIVDSMTIKMSGKRIDLARSGMESSINYEIRRWYKCEINRHVPDSEFTLSAFGLPEPVGVEWERRTPVYVWLLLAAGVLGLLALVLRWLAHRRRTTGES